jgi:carboxymethylenebutenolidase
MEEKMPGQMIELDATTMGYEARPEGDQAQPGVIIVHEVTGLNDYVKEVAEMVAKRDFVALAVDLYEGKTAEGMADGLPLREKVTETVFRDKIGAGIQYLHSRPYCTGRVGVTGFCMGGGFALWAACLFPDDLQGCSIFYGRMDNLALLEQLHHPVIGNFGAEDSGITTWAGERLWPEMVRLGKSLDMKLYPGAPHGFARHNDPRNFYRPEAARDAFERTFALFNQTLRQTLRVDR